MKWPFGRVTDLEQRLGMGSDGMNRTSDHDRVSLAQPKRWRMDEWDRQMMTRDERLTGKIREQVVGLWRRTARQGPRLTSSSQADAEAPAAFETNSKWNLERPTLA